MQPLWKTVWACLKNLKIGLPYDPTIPLLGTYPKKTKRVSWDKVREWHGLIYTTKCKIDS